MAQSAVGHPVNPPLEIFFYCARAARGCSSFRLSSLDKSYAVSCPSSCPAVAGGSRSCRPRGGALAAWNSATPPRTLGNPVTPARMHVHQDASTRASTCVYLGAHATLGLTCLQSAGLRRWVKW